MSSTVHLAVYDSLADWETGFAVAHLNDPQYQREPRRFEVRTVAASPEPVTTMGGVTIVPDTTLEDLRPADSAMLILAGAHGWEAGQHAGMVACAQDFLRAGVPVAAACGATAGLALGGLLDGRRHTSNAREYLAATGYAGGDGYVDAPAVTDGDLITASGVHPVPFAREIFARLELYEPDVLEAWHGLFATGEPVWFDRLMAACAA